ncbi:hypothetical protein KIN13_19355, partial [Vibrio cholerae]|nr:hypothetical protein [Vibrio cholerae]
MPAQTPPSPGAVPMPAAKLLSELKSLGVELWPQDGQLKFRAPQGLLNAERLAQLRE